MFIALLPLFTTLGEECKGGDLEDDNDDMMRRNKIKRKNKKKTENKSIATCLQSIAVVPAAAATNHGLCWRWILRCLE